MMDGAAVTAVIFDCDGVLVDSEVIAVEVERAALAEMGLVYELPVYKRRFLGLPYRDFVAELEADSQARTGRPLPSDFTERLSARYRQGFEERLEAIDGAGDLVERLPLPKGVASSSLLRSLRWKLEKTGLERAFGEHIYSAEQVTRGKPAPDLFLFAAERIGARPHTTLVIEDSVNGILAAKAAGMTAAGFTAGGHCDADHEEHLKAAGADMVFADFIQLGTYLGVK